MILKTVRQARRFFQILIGFTLLLVGVVSLALPVMPGWALIFAGLAVLAAEMLWARRLLDRLKGEGGRLRNKVHGGNATPKSPKPPLEASAPPPQTF